MKRWTHLHTLVAGAVGGIAVTQHPWLIAALAAGAFAVGLAAGRFWLAASRTARFAVEYAQAKLENERRRG